DLDWVLRAMTLAEVNGHWVLAVEGRKGLPPVESFFFARHFMYHQVYHHKAIRAAESLVRAVFVRSAELARDGAAQGTVPRALAAAARGESHSLEDHLALDDACLVAA